MPHSYCSPAWTLTAACPCCHRRLVVRHTRQGHQPFIGCAGYPSCHYTTQYDPALQELSAHNQAMQAYIHRLVRALRSSRATAMWRPEALLHALTHLITTAHPDRWQQGQPATLLAHEITTALLALRAQIQQGGDR